MAALVGLKTSACLLVLGVWGFIMLVLMGVFTRVNAVAFAEDIPINMTEWEALGFPSAYIDEKYAMVSTNCFIAAGLDRVSIFATRVRPASREGSMRHNAPSESTSGSALKMIGQLERSETVKTSLPLVRMFGYSREAQRRNRRPEQGHYRCS
nr:unnamed protein product [Spirometra erinaceieuropaei]